jgi:ABC-type bacteriocin/lantibiotic exporter with double-glycine peptidase domain
MQFRFVYEVASRIAENNLSSYLDGEYTDYVSVDSSIHIRRISQQPIEFSHYVLRGVQQIISNGLLVLLTIIPILLFNSTMFALLFLILLPPAILTILFSKKKLASIRNSGKKNREKTMQHLNEALSGFIEINVYEQKKYFIHRYGIFQEKFNTSLAELQVMQSLPSRLMEVFAIFGLFILVTISSYISSSNSLPVLLIGGFMAAAYKIIPGVVKILNSREQIKTYGFTIGDMLKESNRRITAIIKKNAPITSIEIRNISFAYNGAVVLENFSMKIAANDFAGLSAKSGAGKTTIINLLLGFLTPSSGSILINNENKTATERKAYWNTISYARQQPFFIHESIKNNITLLQEEDEEKLKKILSVTGIDKFISQYPDGMDTILAENGKNISGGQRQRIIMARTLYRDASLVILDEPFNELDRASVNELLSYLNELAKSGKIVLLVTHDNGSLSVCNKIITLHEK